MMDNWKPKKGEMVEVKGLSPDEWVTREFIVDLGIDFNDRYICRWDGRERESCGWEYIRPIKQKKTIPLTADDIIVGKTLVREKGTEYSYFLIVSFRVRYYTYVFDSDFVEVDINDLYKNYEYSNDYGNTWSKCEKEE